MSKEIRMGPNKTGLKAAPIASSAMLECMDLQPAPAHVELDAVALRARYRDDADAVGTMPPPSSFKGVLGSVSQALSGHRLHILLDKMGERAAYERTGVRLYDAALGRLADAPLPEGMRLSQLAEIRDEERKHFLLLCDAIASLGGDPTAQTPCADFAGVQGMGLVQAINDPRATLPQVLHTLLAAELIDVASWELLIEMTDTLGHTELSRQFASAVAAENVHVDRVRRWLALAMDLSASLAGTE